MVEGVRALLDKRELDELVYRTVTALDQGRWEDYGSCFAPEAEFILPDHAVSEAGEANVVKGVERFIPVVRSVLSGFDAVQHHVTNMIHTLSDGEARTDCYVIAEQFLGQGPEGASISVGGSYRIASRRGADGWRITGWQFTSAWTRGDPTLFAKAAAKAGG